MTTRVLSCGFYSRPAIFVAEVQDLQSSAYDHEYSSNQYGWQVVVRDPPPHERGGEDERDAWRRRASNIQHFPINALDSFCRS